MRMIKVGVDPFDGWLWAQLNQKVTSSPGPRPHPALARYQTMAAPRARIGLPARLAAAFSAKAALGLTIGVLAASAAGEAAITGSANPATWGQQVVQQVATCKAALTSGSHGIGPCVSSFASKHGKQNGNGNGGSGATATSGGATPSPEAGQGNGNGNGNGNSQGNGNGNSQGNGNGNGNGNSQGNGKDKNSKGSGNGNGNGNGSSQGSGGGGGQ